MITWFLNPKSLNWLAWNPRENCERSYFDPRTGKDESLYDAIHRYAKGGYTVWLNESPRYHPKWAKKIKRRDGIK